uniref:Uncharacterized protein n=1 Tax=Ciona savignyi TaxID=51511 RepID=H2YF45_CIOSA
MSDHQVPSYILPQNCVTMNPGGDERPPNNQKSTEDDLSFAEDILLTDLHLLNDSWFGDGSGGKNDDQFV